MREILYDGKHEVSIEEVLEKINYYLKLGQEGQKIHGTNEKRAMEIAKDLRQALEKEYKNNNLKKIEDLYEENNYFNDYHGAVHDVVGAITGRLTYENLYSFLCDVSDYMNRTKNGLEGRLNKD